MKKKTQEEFIKEVFDLTKDEYTVLGQYITNKTKILIRHNKCNNEYEVQPNKFLLGKRCPFCSHPHSRKTNEEFIKEVFNLVKDEYTLLSEYKTNKIKVKIRHNKCNTVYYVSPDRFLNGTRCPYCANRKTQEEFIKEVFDLTGNEYTVIGKYINNKTKIKLLHNKCNKEFEITPFSFLSNNNRCPYCRRSKGEERIENWLIKNNIQYEREYKINDCKYKHILPFDFKLDYDDGSFLLIEYDGIQHFKKLKYKNELSLQKKRDNIKNEYCKNHNIELLRINYKDFDKIETILESFIIY